jgi:meiotically up-regulated gene 157 (Mug157) protein
MLKLKQTLYFKTLIKIGKQPRSLATKTTDTLQLAGYRYPVKPVGLICSAFRPSDDATVYSFLVPSNLFAAVSLRQAAIMVQTLAKDARLSNQLLRLAKEVEGDIETYASSIFQDKERYMHTKLMVLAATILRTMPMPSLLSLPYLGQ